MRTLRLSSGGASLARALGIAIALTFVLGPASNAAARVSDDYAYDYRQVWQAAVRLVRVDLGYPIVDRDEEVGFVMFEYREGSRTAAGSVELVRVTASDGTERVRVVVQIPSMPSWTERVILDRLTRKLQADFGDPPRRRATPAPAPTPPPAEEPAPVEPSTSR